MPLPELLSRQQQGQEEPQALKLVLPLQLLLSFRSACICTILLGPLALPGALARPVHAHTLSRRPTSRLRVHRLFPHRPGTVQNAHAQKQGQRQGQGQGQEEKQGQGQGQGLVYPPADAERESEGSGPSEESASGSLSQFLWEPSQRGDLVQWPGLSGSSAGWVQYGGGPIMTDTIVVHFIFYGDWPYDAHIAGQLVLANFVRSLDLEDPQAQGPTVRGWWNIAIGYADSTGATVAPKVITGRSTYIGGEYRQQLQDGSGGSENEILALVRDEIQAGRLPLEERAFYAVLTSKDVRVGDSRSGFCGYPSGYCGWHMQDRINGTAVRVGFIGDGTEQCNDGCGANAGYSETANGHYSMDSLISVFAHELVEAATDPDAATGYTALDQDGTTQWENADLCNGVFTDDEHPDLLTGHDSFAYNLVGVHGFKFLIQANVDLSTQQCSLQRSTTATDGPAEGIIGLTQSGQSRHHGHSGQSKQHGAAEAPCGADHSECSSCAGPDGCRCFKGSCLPACQVAAEAGIFRQCSSCGSAFCSCGTRGQCVSAFA